MPSVIVRPAVLEDLSHIMTWINDPETIANIATIKPPVSEDAEYRWLYWALRNENERIYSVFDKDTGAYIGQCGLHQIYWPARNARMSVIIKKEFQNYGFAHPTAMALLAKAFEELQLHKVWCIVWSDNPKTVHLYRDKVKMFQEGLLVDEYFLDGKYHDMIRFGLTEYAYRRYTLGSPEMGITKF